MWLLLMLKERCIIRPFNCSRLSPQPLHLPITSSFSFLFTLCFSSFFACLCVYLLSSVFFHVFLSTLLLFPSPHPLSLYPLFPIPRSIILGILIVCCEETNALLSFSSALVLLIGIHSTHCSNVGGQTGIHYHVYVCVCTLTRKG